MAKAKPLTLSSEDRSRLESITKTRTLQAQTVTRARILLLKADGESVDAIADKVDLNRNSVLLCLKKYNQGGIENAIYDAPGRGRNAEITDDEKTWIINTKKAYTFIHFSCNSFVHLSISVFLDDIGSDQQVY